MKPTGSKSDKGTVPERSPLGERTFEFTTLDRILFAEIFVEFIETDLAHIKQCLDKSKSAHLLNAGFSLQIFSEKKKLVQKYVKCTDESEKELLRERLVSLLYISFIKQF